MESPNQDPRPYVDSDADLMVVVCHPDGTESYPVYRQILARRSEILDEELSNSPGITSLRLSDVTPEQFEAALKFLKEPCGALFLDENGVADAYPVYHRYGIHDGLALCDDVMVNCLEKWIKKVDRDFDFSFEFSDTLELIATFSSYSALPRTSQKIIKFLQEALESQSMAALAFQTEHLKDLVQEKVFDRELSKYVDVDYLREHYLYFRTNFACRFRHCCELKTTKTTKFRLLGSGFSSIDGIYKSIGGFYALECFEKRWIRNFIDPDAGDLHIIIRQGGEFCDGDWIIEAIRVSQEDFEELVLWCNPGSSDMDDPPTDEWEPVHPTLVAKGENLTLTDLSRTKSRKSDSFKRA